LVKGRGQVASTATTSMCTSIAKLEIPRKKPHRLDEVDAATL
jgi:hypothetical protein